MNLQNDRLNTLPHGYEIQKKSCMSEWRWVKNYYASSSIYFSLEEAIYWAWKDFDMAQKSSYDNWTTVVRG